MLFLQYVQINTLTIVISFHICYREIVSRLDCHQLQWNYWQRQMAPNLLDIIPHCVFVKNGMDIENMLWEKQCNDIEHYKWVVTVHFFGVILKYGIKHCNAVILEAMKISPRNFQGLLRTPSAVNPEILVKKPLSIVKKLHFVQWNIFWATW